MTTHRAPHVFVDETKERGYVMAAATVLPGDVNAARKVLRGLLLPNQQRIHFAKETRPARKKQILTALCELNVQAHIYVADTKNDRAGREACMKSILDDVLDSGAGLLVLERDASLELADKRLIAERFRLESAPPRYAHMSPKDEPMLWVSDAVAWCHHRGGEWRELCCPLVHSVKNV